MYPKVSKSTQKYPKVPKNTQKYHKILKSTQKHPDELKSTQKYPKWPKSTPSNSVSIMVPKNWEWKIATELLAALKSLLAILSMHCAVALKVSAYL